MQVDSFRRHIDLAKRLDKTLVIHDRDAHEEVLAVLDEEGPPTGGSCTASPATPPSRVAAWTGRPLSFAGTVTFKNAAPCARRSP